MTEGPPMVRTVFSPLRNEAGPRWAVQDPSSFWRGRQKECAGGRSERPTRARGAKFEAASADSARSDP